MGKADEVNGVDLFLKKQLNETPFIHLAEELSRLELELESTEREFVNRVQRIIGGIELGETIKGTCSICSKF